MSRQVRKDRCRHGNFGSAAYWEALESRVLLSGLAPAALTGDTVVLFQTAGTGGDSPVGAVAAQFTTASEFTIVDLIGGGSSSSSYTYTVTGETTATLIRQAPDGAHTLTLAFATADTGTLHSVSPDGTGDHAFVLYPSASQLAAPTSVAGEDIVMSVANGGGEYPASGSMRMETVADGDGYVITQLSGSPHNSTGNYGYTAQLDGVHGLASMNLDDSLSGPGMIFLAFTSASDGVFYSTDSNGSNGLSDFSEGSFTLTPTAVHVATTTYLESHLNPAVLGSVVEFAATVTPDTDAVAIGTVTFMEGATVLGTGTLDGAGVATCSTAALGLGRHGISAVYQGNASFNGSTSQALMQIILCSHAGTVSYVSQLYFDLLGRLPDADGLNAWVGAVDSGQSTFGDVATAVTSSREYDGIVVDAFYYQYLGRHSELAGLNVWVDQMQAGLNAEVIRAGILGSQEFYNRQGGTDVLYLTTLYSDFLGRTPDEGGLAYWLGQLNNTNPVLQLTSRVGVSRGISNSTENRRVIATGFYENYLQRGPDDAGLNAWMQNLANGITQPEIISFFVTCPEYLALHQIS